MYGCSGDEYGKKKCEKCRNLCREIFGNEYKHDESSQTWSIREAWLRVAPGRRRDGGGRLDVGGVEAQRGREILD